LLIFIIDHSAGFVNRFFSIFPKKARKTPIFFFYKKENAADFFRNSTALDF